MNPYASLEPFAADRIHVVIDTPRGSRAKYKYDEDAGLMRLSKMLPRGLYFPYNFGFVPGTRGEDGDALDVLVLLDEPLALGCVVTVKLVGVLKARQAEKGETVRNDRLLGVVETAYNPAEAGDIGDLPGQMLAEIEAFFVAYNQAQGRIFTPDGRGNAADALALVDQAREI